jgi:hypothetical protein
VPPFFGVGLLDDQLSSDPHGGPCAQELSTEVYWGACRSFQDGGAVSAFANQLRTTRPRGVYGANYPQTSHAIAAMEQQVLTKDTPSMRPRRPARRSSPLRPPG